MKNLIKRYRQTDKQDRKAVFWFIIAPLLVFLLMVVGYIVNIFKLFGMNEILSSGEGILRIIGVVMPPVGSLMGAF